MRTGGNAKSKGPEKDSSDEKHKNDRRGGYPFAPKKQTKEEIDQQALDMARARAEASDWKSHARNCARWIQNCRSGNRPPPT
jgi:hypothetical protein